jgi:catechol 2,3-dioxygenase-like lactoylglutathione lyase family enzyme
LSITGIHHVQITCPRGQEETARRFYRDVLGFEEVAKPAPLAGRGGLWLAVGSLQLHIGTEDGIDRTATKAHVAYQVTDLASWRARLHALGVHTGEGVSIPGLNRCEFRDPFGNRVEFIEVAR